MKLLVMNGSPNGKKSDSLKMTNAFLDGLQKSIADPVYIEIIDTFKSAVKPCLGCYGCWQKTPGQCVQQDSMKDLLIKITEADLVVWSTPLYAYSFPANLKSIFDRLLPLSSPIQYADTNGDTHHQVRNANHAKHLLIAGCGFPQIYGNFDAMIFQFQRMFTKESQMLLCCEAPLFSVPDAEPLTKLRLALFCTAGMEYAANGHISELVIDAVQHPMLDPNDYRQICSEN